MMKLGIFDMGGVVVQGYQIWPRLRRFLGYVEHEAIAPAFNIVMAEYCRGLISEGEVWKRYTRITGRALPPHEGSLMTKFFTPCMDAALGELLLKLKARGIRIVCGTNTIDAHYAVHKRLGQYDDFDTVYASHLIHKAKPDTAFFTHILAAEGALPEETFFTDDRPANVEAAAALGIAAFVFSNAAALANQLRAAAILV